jgi:hypothetical protein
MDPVSLIAIVPVAECRMPILTVLSVTAKPVVLTLAVGKSAAKALLVITPAVSNAPTSAPPAFMKLRLLKVLISVSPKLKKLTQNQKKSVTASNSPVANVPSSNVLASMVVRFSWFASAKLLYLFQGLASCLFCRYANQCNHNLNVLQLSDHVQISHYAHVPHVAFYPSPLNGVPT